MERGFERPPWWAVAVGVLALVVLIVGVPIAAHRGGEPLSKAELASLDSAESAARASDLAAQPKPALMLGDSYSAGTGTTSAGHRFTTLVAGQEHWVESNHAFGGTGYVNAPTGPGCGQGACPNYGDALKQWTGASPKVVLVAGGRNDLIPARDPGYAGSVASFFQALRTRFPDATLLAVSPLWDDSQTPAALATVADAVKAGVQAVGGTYLDVGQPLANHPELLSPDGIHPNDDGHRAIADAVVAAIKAAGIKT